MKRLELTDEQFEALPPQLREIITRHELAQAQASMRERGTEPQPEFEIPRLEGFAAERKRDEDRESRMTSGGGLFLGRPSEDPLSR